MPALRSFAMTAPQMRCGIKTATRRDTCSLEAGQLICATDRSQRVDPLYEELGVWRVLGVSGPAPLSEGLSAREVTYEGFTGWTPEFFMRMYCGGDTGWDRPVYRVEIEPTAETRKAIRARIIDAALTATIKNRPLVIGKAPNRGKYKNSDGWPALYGGPAGRRLGKLLSFGHSDARFAVRMLERRNLLNRWPGKKFPVELARQAARQMAGELTGRVVICAGRDVWDALCRAIAPAHRDDDFLSVVEPEDGPRVLALMPHPVGHSAWWNDQEKERLTGEWLRQLTESSEQNDDYSIACVPRTQRLRTTGNVHPFAFAVGEGTYCPVCGRWLS